MFEIMEVMGGGETFEFFSKIEKKFLLLEMKKIKRFY